MAENEDGVLFSEAGQVAGPSHTATLANISARQLPASDTARRGLGRISEVGHRSAALPVEST